MVVPSKVGTSTTPQAEGAALNLPRELLPPKAKEGSWLTLDIIPEGDFVAGREALPEGSQPQNIKLDDKSTAASRQRIAVKLARLRKGDYN